MKTPENFNHTPNVGLTPMAKTGSGPFDKSLLDCDKSFTPQDEAKNGGGTFNSSVLSFKEPSVAGTNMAK